MKRICLLILSLVLLTLADVDSSAQSTKRVSFAKNSKTAVFNDSANERQNDTYTLILRKNQTVDVFVEWAGEDVGVEDGQGLSGFTIVYPNGKRFEDPQDGFVKADRAGVYKFVVSAPNKKTNYRYKITFTLQ